MYVYAVINKLTKEIIAIYSTYTKASKAGWDIENYIISEYPLI